MVFGLEEDIQGIIALKDLAEKVAAVNGFMIAAPPLSRLSGGERRQIGSWCGQGCGPPRLQAGTRGGDVEQ